MRKKTGARRACVLLGFKRFHTWAGCLRFWGLGQTLSIYSYWQLTVWRWDSRAEDLAVGGGHVHLLLHLRERYQRLHGIAEGVMMLDELADPFRQTWDYTDIHIRDKHYQKSYSGQLLPPSVQAERQCSLTNQVSIKHQHQESQHSHCKHYWAPVMYLLGLFR